jgi:hypothetical protein
LLIKSASAQPVRSSFIAPGELPPFPVFPLLSLWLFSFVLHPAGSPDKRGIAAKKIVEKHVSFFNQKKRPSADHVYHTIHHNFTTKAPRPKLAFLKKPLQNHS